MARVKTGPSRSKKHKAVKRLARGFKQARRKRVRVAKESVFKAGQYAYAGRKLKKRALKKLWIMRLNAAVREKGLKYSQFVNMLKVAKIELNRKMLSEIAATDPAGFAKIVEECAKK